MSNVQQIIEPSDKPVAKLVEHAHSAIKSWQRNSQMTPRVIFKHTCGCCGQRGFIEAPNTVPANVQCGNCGNIQPYEKGGYSLAFELSGTQPHGTTANATQAVTFATPEQATVNKSAPSMTPNVPVKIGMRLNPDQSITPIDSDALMQFCATLERQAEKEAANATA